MSRIVPNDASWPSQLAANGKSQPGTFQIYTAIGPVFIPLLELSISVCFAMLLPSAAQAA
jgi:hypothetical protein